MAEFKQLHLLSVGIDHYAPESELPDTPFAEADARELARVFEMRCGFSTTVLTGPQATCAAIQKAMHQIGQQRGTTFIFSFCGHGQDIRGQYHLHPYDSTAFGSSTVLFDSLTRQWQNGFGYQQVVSILDACRTEVAFGSRGSASFTAEAARDIEASIASGAKRVEVLYGCRQGERSWAYKEIGHGLLTAAVVDVVENHPRGSDLDFHGMVARAADWMEESPVRRKYGKARRQTPHLYGTPSLKNRIIILPAEPREDQTAKAPTQAPAQAPTPAPAKAPASSSPQPFTIFAQRVMDRANEEAKAYNHEYTGTEHILLGLVEKGGVGAAILKKRGISAQEIREALEKLMPRGPRMVSMGRLPYTHYAKSVLAYADDERLSRGLMLIDTEHLLLGLLHERNGAANKVLTKLGLTVEETRQAIVSERTAPAAREAPPKSLIARRWKTIVILIMAVALIDRASLWRNGLSFFTSRTSGFTDFLIVAIIVFMFARRSK